MIHWHRIILTILLGLYFVRFALHPAEPLLIYNVDFVFHEAGHVVFGLFGELLMHLGGTLMQLILPLGACIYFLMRDQRFSSAMVLYWIGENWINISIYARDARSRLLPLHGGDNVTHDWSEILYTLNLLHRDQGIGDLFFVTGCLCMIGAFLWGMGLSFTEESLD